MLDIIRAFEAAHPACAAEMIDIGISRNQLTWLRGREVDVLAHAAADDRARRRRPTLSREVRQLAVARHHPLAGRESVCLEDLADYRVTDHPSFAREMMREFVPSHTPSGRPIERTRPASFADVVMRVANGQIVHPTVGSFVDYYRHPGVVAIPIRDLPPSETALAWLTGGETAKLRAFVDVAGAVVGDRFVRST